MDRSASCRPATDRSELTPNWLLAGLPPADLAQLQRQVEICELRTGDVLHEPGDALTHALFPAGCVVSVTIALPDGTAAEVASIGREGAIGTVAGATRRHAFARMTVQVAGAAVRLDLARLAALRAVSRPLDDRLHRYADALLAQSFQSTACNALHPLEQRLVRWLLTTLDRIGDGAGHLWLTQDALGLMVGAHRVSVAEILARLEGDGIVDRGRGRIRVIDRRQLERRSCACYRAVRDHYESVLPGGYAGGPPAAGAARG